MPPASRSGISDRAIVQVVRGPVPETKSSPAETPEKPPQEKEPNNDNPKHS